MFSLVYFKTGFGNFFRELVNWNVIWGPPLLTFLGKSVQLHQFESDPSSEIGITATLSGNTINMHVYVDFTDVRRSIKFNLNQNQLAPFLDFKFDDI